MGFHFFAPAYQPTSKIRIDGFPSCMKGLKVPFGNKMGDGFFPIKFDELKAKIQYLGILNIGSLKIDNVVIDRIPLHHPQGGFGFRFQEGNKRLVFITDNELEGEEWSGRQLEDFINFCKDADILIHDAQYTPAEIKNRKGWGHSDYAAVLNLAMQAHVKRLILFHHDPSRKDIDLSSFLTRCEDLGRENNSDLIIDAAREGSELTL